MQIWDNDIFILIISIIEFGNHLVSILTHRVMHMHNNILKEIIILLVHVFCLFSQYLIILVITL